MVPTRLRSSGPGESDARVELRHDAQHAVLAHGLHQRDGTGPADRDGQHAARENHCVPHRQNRKLFDGVRGQRRRLLALYFFDRHRLPPV